MGPKGDKALRMGQGGANVLSYIWADIRKDRWTDPPCVLQDFVTFRASLPVAQFVKEQQVSKVDA